jgi:hypothetical protein
VNYPTFDESRQLGILNQMGILPGMTAFAIALMHKKIAEVGVLLVREYVQMLIA